MAQAYDRAWVELRRVQRRVDWENFGDRVTDVRGVGRIIVRDWRLLGAPGKEYLRLFFTYENTTPQQLKEARVWASVRDAAGKIRSTEWLDLYIPWYEFAPGNTWTGELRVATHGAHALEGWTWEVGAAADPG